MTVKKFHAAPNMNFICKFELRTAFYIAVHFSITNKPESPKLEMISSQYIHSGSGIPPINDPENPQPHI